VGWKSGLTAAGAAEAVPSIVLVVLACVVLVLLVLGRRSGTPLLGEWAGRFAAVCFILSTPLALQLSSALTARSIIGYAGLFVPAVHIMYRIVRILCDADRSIVCAM